MKQFAFLLSILSAQWVHADMDTAYRATCRVHARGHAGTGCVYAKDAENYYVLTNAHVAGVLSGEPMECVFNDRGHERSVKGQTIWGSLIESAHRDQALIAIPISQFTDFQPAIIPLAPRGATLTKGQTVLSVGCPRATWAGLWRGHIESVSATTIDFLPIPAGGRSGSAIFDETGTYIIGLITWNAGETGRAQSIEGIYQGLLGEAAQAVFQPSADTVQQPYAPLVEIYPSQQPDCPDCERRPRQRPNQPQNPGDDGQFNPAPIPPQTLPANPYPPSSNNPAPIPPTSPVTPPATSPAKGCECTGDNACKCDNGELIKRLDALTKNAPKACECDESKILAKLAELESKLSNPAPVPTPPTTPAIPGSEAPKLSHYVVVADFNSPTWSRTESELVMARKTFPKIHVVKSSDVPFTVTPFPQLIAYDTTGAAMSIVKGQADVESSLRRVARGG